MFRSATLSCLCGSEFNTVIPNSLLMADALSTNAGSLSDLIFTIVCLKDLYIALRILMHSLTPSMDLFLTGMKLQKPEYSSMLIIIANGGNCEFSIDRYAMSRCTSSPHVKVLSLQYDASSEATPLPLIHATQPG